jgi:hypothetical protein
MIEILKSFEQVASRFNPPVLMVPGLAMVALGLVAWLGGMCARRLVLALFGAAVGAIAAVLIHGRTPPVVSLAAAGGALFGTLLPRLSTAIVLASFGMAVVLVFMAPTPAGVAYRLVSGPQETGQDQAQFTVRESLDVVQAYALNLMDRVRSILSSLEWPDRALLAAVGLALLVLGLFLVRLAGALTCSALGAALVFAGLTVLLILKGSDPIALLQSRGRFYGLVLLGMTAFGTLEQLVLCPPPGRRPKAGRPGSGKEESEYRSRSAAAHRGRTD